MNHVSAWVSAWVCAIALCGSTACTGGPGSLPSSSGGFGSSDLESTGSDTVSSSGSDNSNSSSGNGNGNGSSGVPTGGDTQIRASDYDQSCKTAADCYPIYQGDACEQCACPNAAIAKSDLLSYATKKGSAGCQVDTNIQCDPCATSTECTGGVCGVTH